MTRLSVFIVHVFQSSSSVGVLLQFFLELPSLDHMTINCCFLMIFTPYFYCDVFSWCFMTPFACRTPPAHQPSQDHLLIEDTLFPFMKLLFSHLFLSELSSSSPSSSSRSLRQLSSIIQRTGQRYTPENLPLSWPALHPSPSSSSFTFSCLHPSVWKLLCGSCVWSIWIPAGINVWMRGGGGSWSG